MKNLGNVTWGDAMLIICAGHPEFLVGDKLSLKDEKEVFEEDCHSMVSEAKNMKITFFGDSIVIFNQEENKVHDDFVNSLGLDHVEISYKSYLQAHLLGYYVPLLSENISPQKTERFKMSKKYES